MIIIYLIVVMAMMKVIPLFLHNFCIVKEKKIKKRVSDSQNPKFPFLECAEGKEIVNKHCSKDKLYAAFVDSSIRQKYPGCTVEKIDISTPGKRMPCVFGAYTENGRVSISMPYYEIMESIYHYFMRRYAGESVASENEKANIEGREYFFIKKNEENIKTLDAEGYNYYVADNKIVAQTQESVVFDNNDIACLADDLFLSEGIIPYIKDKYGELGIKKITLISSPVRTSEFKVKILFAGRQETVTLSNSDILTTLKWINDGHKTFQKMSMPETDLFREKAKNWVSKHLLEITSNERVTLKLLPEDIIISLDIKDILEEEGFFVETNASEVIISAA